MRNRAGTGRPGTSGAPARAALEPAAVGTAPDSSPFDAHAARPCTSCGAVVRWREVKFCLDRRSRFSGRVYCIACQAEFPAG